METPARIARAALNRVVDFALPPRCPGCGAITSAPHSFCMTCWSGMHFLGEPCCRRCALPFEYGGAELECAGCLAHPPDFDRLRAAVAYADVPRAVALKLKYSGRPGVAETMAKLMARHLAEMDGMLVPVPLHRWRIWKRGYNQAALIAASLGRIAGRPVDLGLIERIRPTPPLKGMNPRQRALAVRGAFRIAEGRGGAVDGRRIVLIDDVYTSGATANACARLLRKSGAAEVNILCWARVVRAGD